MNNEKNKLEAVLKPASFISLKATASTGVLINQFPNIFKNIETQKQFYLDMLCLHIDIYHRLGAGIINPNDDKNIPSAEELDKRIGTVAGIALAYVNNQSKKSPFMEGIDIELLQDAFGKFHDWAVEFKNIHDGRSTLLSNFVSKWVETLSIAKGELDKFVFSLSDSIRQYLNDARFTEILNIK